MDQLEAAVLGVGAAVAAVILMNLWPSLYRWGAVITLGEGRSSGRHMYAVRFGRRSDVGRPESRLGGLLRRRIFKGPIDVTFHARVAIVEQGESEVRKEKVVPIPLDKAWRPSVNPGVILWLLPERCDLELLRTFPDDIRAKREAGTLTLEDLLDRDGSQLRLYAFCYRRYMGTRFVKYSKYTQHDLRPGSHKKGRFVPAPAGKLPQREDIPNSRPERVLNFGDIRIEVSRVDDPEAPGRIGPDSGEQG
jgi:hypothetical protein